MVVFVLGLGAGVVVGLVLAYLLGERKRKRELAAKPPDTRRTGRTEHGLK